MTCTNCGEEIPASANFCSSCGSPIENGHDQQDEGQSQVEQSARANDAKGEDATGGVQLQSLQETVTGIVSELAHLSDRISALEVGRRYGATPAQVALAWLLRDPEAIVIPGARSIAQLEANAATADLELSPEDTQIVEQATHT